jgi:hypothetical protein
MRGARFSSGTSTIPSWTKTCWPVMVYTSEAPVGARSLTIFCTGCRLCCLEATRCGSIRAISLRAPFQPQSISTRKIVEEQLCAANHLYAVIGLLSCAVSIRERLLRSFCG